MEVDVRRGRVALPHDRCGGRKGPEAGVLLPSRLSIRRVVQNHILGEIEDPCQEVCVDFVDLRGRRGSAVRRESSCSEETDLRSVDDGWGVVSAKELKFLVVHSRTWVLWWAIESRCTRAEGEVPSGPVRGGLTNVNLVLKSDLYRKPKCDSGSDTANLRISMTRRAKEACPSVPWLGSAGDVSVV